MKNKMFFIFLILVSINQISSYKCGFYDEVKNEPGPIHMERNLTERRTAKVETHKIKIKADFSSFTKISGIDDDSYKKCKKLVEETLDLFGQFLKITPVAGTFSDVERIKENCKISKIDSNWKNFFDNYDIIIFPFFSKDMSSSTLACACRCLYDNNGRSYAGYLKINPSISFSKTNIETYFKQIVFHEITHVLLFNPSIFEKLKLMSRVGNDNTKCAIVSEKALSLAREHFGCNSLEGIPLEDQGGSGSSCGHWESRYMLGDYMISTDYLDNVVSDITLALFEDSGIYEVKYYSGNLFKFGKGKGCNFFNKKCIELVAGKRKTSFEDEFCTDYDEEICSNSRISKGTCILNNFNNMINPTTYRYFANARQGGFTSANYCPVCSQTSKDTGDDYYPNNCNLGKAVNYGEKMGDSSFCFMSSLVPSNNANTKTKPTCYKIECDTKKKNIIVHVGSSKVTCPTNGGTQTLSGFKGSIDCPKYNDLCDVNNLCNTMIDCLKGHSRAKKSKLDKDSYTYLDDENNNSNRDNKPGNGENNINFIKKNSSINLKHNFYYIISLLILLI